MSWLFWKRCRPPFSLYLVAPPGVMTAARQKMLRELNRRIKKELHRPTVFPTRHGQG